MLIGVNKKYLLESRLELDTLHTTQLRDRQRQKSSLLRASSLSFIKNVLNIFILKNENTRLLTVAREIVLTSI